MEDAGKRQIHKEMKNRPENRPLFFLLYNSNLSLRHGNEKSGIHQMPVKHENRPSGSESMRMVFFSLLRLKDSLPFDLTRVKSHRSLQSGN